MQFPDSSKGPTAPGFPTGGAPPPFGAPLDEVSQLRAQVAILQRELATLRLQTVPPPHPSVPSVPSSSTSSTLRAIVMSLNGPVLHVNRADVVGKTFHFCWGQGFRRQVQPQADGTMIQLRESHPNEGRWQIENGVFCTVNSDSRQLVARFSMRFRSGGKLIMASLGAIPHQLVEV